MEGPSSRRSASSVVVVLVALLGAGVAAWVAPSSWEPGPAAVEVRTGSEPGAGGEVTVVPIVLGSTDPVRHDEGPITVSLPGGAGLDVPIEIVVVSPGFEVGAAEVEVTIVTGAARHRVPVLDVADGTARAVRRPPVDVDLVLAVLAVAVVLWVSEVVPVMVTSLAIPVALAVFDVGPADDVLAPFFDPIIVLFLGGFLMAVAMQRTGLDERLAVTIVAVFGSGPRRLFATFVVLAAAMSMWMSNTAAVTVLVPIALAVTAPLGSRGYTKTTVLALAYGATIGGVGSAIGTPANPMAMEFVERLTGRTISFVDWFAFGLPMSAVFLPTMIAYMWRVGDVSIDASRFAGVRAEARRRRHELGAVGHEEREVVAVFAVVMGLWLTQSWHHQNTGIVALGGAVALFALGRLRPGDVGSISWPTLLTFGGGLTIGTFMVSSGASDWIVTELGGVGGLPDLVAVAVVASVTLALTTVASNTAAAATLIPLAVPLAGLIGVDPVTLVVVVAIASSVDFALVIGTPPTMIAYGTDLFTVREILAKGSVLDAVGIALLVLVVVPSWSLLGIV